MNGKDGRSMYEFKKKKNIELLFHGFQIECEWNILCDAVSGETNQIKDIYTLKIKRVETKNIPKAMNGEFES